jgi:hypothetical protein
MRRIIRLLGLSVLTALVLVAPAQAQDCDASVDVTLDRSDPDRETMRYQFRVEISTSESCAHIHYDLILDVQLPNGHVKKVRKPRIVKLSDSSLEEVVRHEIPIDQKVTEQEARVVKCETCDLGT